MSAISSIPTFAVLGEPNDGKTTVVATLAEVDSAEIHPDPGTTKVCKDFPVVFDEQEVIRFVDTPGFENPLEAVEWFEAHENETGSLAEKFCAEHAHTARFAMECELLKPLTSGAAVIYVVDGSQPVRQTDRAQIEILRLATPSNRPRVAVINSHSDDTVHREAWQSALHKSFNIVCEFNAHRASFGDRLELLHSIRPVIQKWKPILDECIAAFREDWQKRIDKSADAICELLKVSLGCSQSEPVTKANSEKEAARQAAQGLKEMIRTEEERFRKKVRGYFRHRRISGPANDSLLLGDLFSKEVVSVFGLPKHALALVGATIGSILFYAGDVFIHGGAVPIVSSIGGGLGYIAGYWGADKLVSIEVPGLLRRLLPRRMKKHGRCVEAKPSPLSNLPWVLLGRSIEFFHWASTWAHGRRDQPDNATTAEDTSIPWKVKNWNKEQKDVAAAFIALVSVSRLQAMSDKVKEFFRRQKKDPETVEREMKEMLVEMFKKMNRFQ